MLKAIIGEVIGRIIGKIVVLALIFGAVAYFTNGRSLAVAKSFMGAQSEDGALAGLSLEGLPGKDQLSAFFGKAAPAERVVKAKARIAVSDFSCRLLDLHSARPSRTEAMPCARARALQASPAFSMHVLREYAAFEYLYYAPGGQEVLTGRFEKTDDTPTDLRVGSVIEIEIDSADPSISKPI